jgi:TetR/AcrR family transcriptional repressor of bet genes
MSGMFAIMTNETTGAVEPQVEKKVRKASKETRRMQLIEATIDSLAKRGYSETTMADVADGAGLSRGIVNFHFESKDKLLVATLQHMAEEYAAHWRGAVAKAGTDPASRLKALVSADFDRGICSRRKLAAWCAFWGEAKSRPTYQALCGARDEHYQDLLAELCEALIAEGHYNLDARQTALGLDALLEGLWLRLMLSNGKMKREVALKAALSFLSAIFPKHFASEGVNQEVMK